MGNGLCKWRREAAPTCPPLLETPAGHPAIFGAASLRSRTVNQRLLAAFGDAGPLPHSLHTTLTSEFAQIDPRKAQVVELRYFGGLSVEETAEALNVHPNTVIRDWSLARVWLKRELTRGESAHAG